MRSAKVAKERRTKTERKINKPSEPLSLLEAQAQIGFKMHTYTPNIR